MAISPIAKYDRGTVEVKIHIHCKLCCNQAQAFCTDNYNIVILKNVN